VSQELITRPDAGGALALPNIIHREDPKTTKRFLEFFTTNIRNENTRGVRPRRLSVPRMV
jgi:hypothetical protein